MWLPSAGWGQSPSNIEMRAQAAAEVIDLQQILSAKRWTEAFEKLDPTNNIEILISLEDNLVEIDHVTEMKSHSRFLIVKYKHENGRFYQALIFPGTILLIREAP